MSKIEIVCENGALVVTAKACGNSITDVIFPPFRAYGIGENSTQIVGADDKNTTIPNDGEITFDGQPITADELKVGLMDGTICGAENGGGGSDCCADLLIGQDRILTNVVQHFNMFVPANDVINATAAAVEEVKLCCAANTAAIADLLQLIQCGENPVPQIVSVDGTVTSSNTNQVGSLLTINGSGFTEDFVISFSDSGIQITSWTFVDANTITVGVIGGPTVGFSDVTITSSFPDGCPTTDSGATGVGLVETIDVVFEDVTWLGNAPNVSLLDPSGLTKTGGGSSWTNGGAYGSKGLVGDGYLEFVVAPPATGLFMVGLNPDASAGANWNQINHAVYHNNGGLRVYEQGQYKALLGTFSIPMTVRITVTGTVVNYSVNGTVLHTSNVAAIFPLYPDATMFNVGSTFSTANIYGIVN